jgi:hypothetical protein
MSEHPDIPVALATAPTGYADWLAVLPPMKNGSTLFISVDPPQVARFRNTGSMIERFCPKSVNKRAGMPVLTITSRFLGCRGLIATVQKTG